MPNIDWNRGWAANLNRYLRRSVGGGFYGNQWGDPEVRGWRYAVQRVLLPWRFPGNLSRVVELYIRPFVTPESVVLEIGAGGGRWTKYMLRAREIIVVDLNPEFFDYLRQRFPESVSKFSFYRTNGFELDGIESESVDYLFTFGTFVHIDPEGIDAYLGEIRRVLRPGAQAVVQYADKTKLLGRLNPGFSNMNRERLEALASRHSLLVAKHDLGLLNHSNIAVLRKPPGGQTHPAGPASPPRA